MSIRLVRQRGIPRIALFLLLAISAWMVVGCGGSGGGSGGSNSGISVQVSPKSVSLVPNGSKTFSATVTGTSNSGVTWSCSGGAIDQAGNYTAPSQAGSFTVTATSAADASAIGTANVSVKSNSGITVTVKPSSVALAAGAQKQFTATVSGTSKAGVTWSATTGTITQSGLYTAPNATTTATITATSTADSTAFGTATATVSKPTVKITPGSPTCGTHETTQFSATVTGLADQSVTWTCQGGTISSSGLFRAGETPGSYSVFATSAANTSVFGSVTIIVSPIKLTVKPNGLNMAVNSSQQFSATVTGPNNKAVTWTSSAGSINSSGVFTAPTTGQIVTITATSAADPTIKGTASVNVVVPSTFFYDFNNGVPGVWSPANGAITPSGVKFCGQLIDGQTETLTLSGLSAHSSVTVTFDVYAIGAWTGLTGNNTLAVNIGGTQAFSQSFSNVTGDDQSFPNSSTSAPGTGATALNSLGYTHDPTILYNDAVYHVTCSAAHTADSITITFTGNLTGAVTDMSWGLKNVKVVANP